MQPAGADAEGSEAGQPAASQQVEVLIRCVAEPGTGEPLLLITHQPADVASILEAQLKEIEEEKEVSGTLLYLRGRCSAQLRSLPREQGGGERGKPCI